MRRHTPQAHMHAHTHTGTHKHTIHGLLFTVWRTPRICDERAQILWMTPSYESKCSLKFKFIIPYLQLSSFKQLRVFIGEPDDLPEGVWVGGLCEQQNKLQNNPLHHITHWACNPPPSPRPSPPSPLSPPAVENPLTVEKMHLTSPAVARGF